MGPQDVGPCITRNNDPDHQSVTIIWTYIQMLEAQIAQKYTRTVNSISCVNSV